MEESKYFENIASMKLMAKHEVGQNFLINPEIAKRIVDYAELDESDDLLEIGCGAGSLSYYLAQSKATSTLIDIDEGLLTKVRNDFDGNERLKIINANAMKYDYSSYTKIIGNLPYYITSAIIKNVLVGAKKCKKIVFMVQTEAHDRMFAKIGKDGYSPLNILIEYRLKKTSSFKVSRNCFAPAPHVDSTVFCADFNGNSDVETAIKLYDLTVKMFENRRKTIENNLSKIVGGKEKSNKLLLSLGINPKARPEQLSLSQYLLLLDALEQQ